MWRHPRDIHLWQESYDATPLLEYPPTAAQATIAPGTAVKMHIRIPPYVECCWFIRS